MGKTDKTSRQTIIDLFEESVRQYPDNPYLLEKKGDEWRSASYAAVRRDVCRFAAGLLSLGIRKGDRLALLSEGRNDWVISELGMLYAGAINVPLSVKLADVSEIAFRLRHSGCRMLVASGGQSAKLGSLRDDLSELEKVILLDRPDAVHPQDISLAEVMSRGDAFLRDHPGELEARWAQVGAEDVATICYTSGTTADPKGIMLSHRNYTANVEQALTLMAVPPWYCTLLILPWDHSFAHTAGIYTLMAAGGSLASVQAGKTGIETLKNIPVNIREIRPVFLMSVPALANSFRRNIEKGVFEKGALAKGLFQLALKVAYAHNLDGWSKGRGWRALLKPACLLFDRILFKKIRAGFGGRLKFFIGGGALLDIELQRFFYALGMPMFQGYGLTEAAPIISSNSENRHKLGSSGCLVKPLDLKICGEKGDELPLGEKGEIVVRGENVMQGYWRNEKASREALRDGWLYTGDMGFMDRDGFLYVLGRFKSLLIADDGEKYSPEGIEEALVGHSKFIDQCMLYNSQNPYTVALIVPNKEALQHALRGKGLDPASRDGKIAALRVLEAELNEYRSGRKHASLFPQRWLPAAVAVLAEPFSETNQLMNSTMKMVRGKIVERYRGRIDYLYTAAAKDIGNEQNMDAIGRLLAG